MKCAARSIPSSIAVVAAVRFQLPARHRLVALVALHYLRAGTATDGADGDEGNIDSQSNTTHGHSAGRKLFAAELRCRSAAQPCCFWASRRPRPASRVCQQLRHRTHAPKIVNNRVRRIGKYQHPIRAGRIGDLWRPIRR